VRTSDRPAPGRAGCVRERSRSRPPRHDAIVVGGGLYGASILLQLARRGVHAVLLERSHLASGPTSRSSANIRLHYTTPELAELARIGVDTIGRFGELTGGGENGFMRVGVLYGFGEVGVPSRRTSGGPATSASRSSSSTGRGWRRSCPASTSTGSPANAWEPTAGYADPVGTTAGFADGAIRLGAAVRLNSPVARVLAEGGHVEGVVLVSGARVLAPRVHLAAGHWSKGRAATVGVGLPLVPERATRSRSSPPRPGVGHPALRLVRPSQPPLRPARGRRLRHSRRLDVGPEPRWERSTRAAERPRWLSQ
jgi:glycine/D-amino acid oxidase-like deaminating enzyme